MKLCKRALLLAFACALCFMLSGCHGSRGLQSFSVPESFDEGRQHELTFWAKNDTNKAQTMIYERAIEEFQALYPNITIKLRLYTDYGKIYNDVITNISTGTTPNICITYPDHIATYMTGENTVAPLDELIADEKYGLGGSELRFDAPAREDMIDKFMDEGVIDGHQYALPYMRSTEACYVNKTYVEALGFTLPDKLTWDFVWEVAEAATAKDADGNFIVNGQKVMIPFIYKSTDNMMIQMLSQRGAGYSTPEGEALLFSDDTRALLEEIARHTATGAFSTFKISGYPANFLNAGQCIFAVDSTAGATWMGSDAPLVDISDDKLVQFETAVMEVPQFDTENPRMISQGPSVCVFNKSDPQEVLASWLFVQYLVSDGIQVDYAKTEGYVPVTHSAQRSEAYKDYLARGGEDDDEHYRVKIEATQLLLDHVDDTFVTPVFNGSASLRDAAGQLIENVTKSVRRKQTIDDAYFKALYDDVSSLYRLDQSGDAAAGRKELGEMPGESVALIASLIAAWVLLGAWAIASAIRKKRLSNKQENR